MIACLLNNPLDPRVFCDSDITFPTHSRAGSMAPEERANLAAAAKSFTENGPISPLSSFAPPIVSDDTGLVDSNEVRQDARRHVLCKGQIGGHEDGAKMTESWVLPFEKLQKVPGNEVRRAMQAVNPCHSP